MNEQNFGIPDEGLLNQLANELFKSAPGIPVSIPTNANSLQQLSKVDTEAKSEALPYGVLESIPQSLAGSGSSPSAIANNNSFDIHNPQTSFPDPHFSNGDRIPQSVAGSGISPSYNQSSAATIPNTPKLEEPFNIGSANANTVPLKFPGIGVNPNELLHTGRITDPTYYFLTGNNPFSYGREVGAFGINPSFNRRTPVGFAAPAFDVNRYKADFPILKEVVHGTPLIWLDNAATTHKPNQVIDRISYFYKHENSNIHRAAHDLAARATDAYEGARQKVQRFINASSANEIVFVRGATEAINLVAKTWGEQNIKAGDEIIVSHLEHHANIVPWQQLVEKNGAVLRVIPVDDDGQVILDEYGRLLNSKTKLVSFTQVSNALGTVTPAKLMVEMAHNVGAKVLIDGAQAVSHMRVDVQNLNSDWYVFSGHKVFGPTGIGVVYGKEEILNEMQPWQGGGNMIEDVTFEHTKYQKAPAKFEAGTGNIADAVGLGAAVDYVSRIGIDLINQYEHYLLHYATYLLKDIPGLRLIGTAPDKAGVLSFVINGFRTEEIGKALSIDGIAVRSGHHCAQPILRRFGVESSVRPSLAFYNTCQDIDALIFSLHKLTSRS